MKKLILLLIAAIAFTGCGSQEGDFTVAPDIYFECNEINALCNASTAGKVVYMGLTRNLEIDCANELLDLEPSLFQSKFEYWGSTTAEFDGSYIFGAVTQWANSSGGKVHNFYDTDYKICAFIDEDDNDRLGINEMLAEQLFNVMISFEPVTSWTLP